MRHLQICSCSCSRRHLGRQDAGPRTDDARTLLLLLMSGGERKLATVGSTVKELRALGPGGDGCNALAGVGAGSTASSANGGERPKRYKIF
uniref:Uncharacterized protein n=1 Tax=Oryza sativa subsp. japonica TaxID=39947 RepID=Q6H467_ORYSJ|nr:hypothetical protein [Oryza sativa Japonica Group]